MELVCPEPCFQAPTEEECFRHVRTWTSSRIWRKNRTVISAIDSLQQVDMGIDMQDFLSQTGFLNLYVIAAALHSITFHIRLSMGVCLDLLSLRIMLSNWKTVWNNRALARNNPPFGIETHNLGFLVHCGNDWRRDGFMEHAPEVWLLSKKLLWCIESSKQHSMQKSLSGSEAISSKQSLGAIAFVLPTQERYDDTSMNQLTQLLSSFESMKV
jgi:hypothetical protein